MNWLLWLNDIEIPEETIGIIACVVPGAFFLTFYTRMSGITGYVINAILLFGGAYAANVLMSGLILRIDYLQRVLLTSLGGMVVVSLAMLFLFPRPKKG